MLSPKFMNYLVSFGITVKISFTEYKIAWFVENFVLKRPHFLLLLTV